MKKTLLSISSVLLINCFLVAQEYKSVTVKAGTRLKDYFTISQRYLYPDFTQGKVIFNNRMTVPCLFNFNLISGEMEFIKSKDTLIITSKKEIDLIVVARDTFYYHDAYLQLISSGPVCVFLKRSIAVKNILKQGAMGTINRSAASESYNFAFSGQLSIDLKPVDDMVLQRTDEYLISRPGNDYMQYNKKNILKMVPGKEGEIKDFIKSIRVDFESRDDLLKLADFVNSLLTGNRTKK